MTTTMTMTTMRRTKMTTHKQKWEVEFTQNDQPLMVRGRVAGGKWMKPQELPEYVKLYCCLRSSDNTCDFEWRHVQEHMEKTGAQLTVLKMGFNRLTILLDRAKIAKGVQKEVGSKVTKLEKALQALNEGRNLSCWPLCSFDWKDADLDPEGCTGIKKILWADRKNVALEVGGHVTICDPTHECEWVLTEDDRNGYSDVAHSIVCDHGLPGEWTGDDWSLHEHVTVVVAWRKTIKQTAKAIIAKAHAALKDFRESSRLVNKDMDALYKEIREKYDPARKEKEQENG
jgi:hypothetical protein